MKKGIFALSLMLLICIASAQFQNVQAQTSQSLAVVMVCFADSSSDLSRGSWGYGPDLDPPNNVREGIYHKYRYRDYYDFFFKEGEDLANGRPNNHPNHPDSSTHNSDWIATQYLLRYYGSVRQYFQAISYGDFDLVPYSMPGNNHFPGILNEIDTTGESTHFNGRIKWLVLPYTRSYYESLGYPSGKWSIMADTKKKIRSELGLDTDTVTWGGLYIIASGIIPAGWHPSVHDGAALCWEKLIPSGGDICKSAVFNAMTQAAHEIVHLIFSVGDYFGSGAYYPRWMSQTFSLMGDTFSVTGPWIPSMIHPLFRIQQGWCNTIVLDEGLHSNIDLSIIERPDSGGKPTVLIVPLETQFNPATLADGSFLMIENRKAVEWDMLANADMTSPVAGGFFVWYYNPQHRNGNTNGGLVIASDGDFSNFYGGKWDLEQYGAGFRSPQIFSTWSEPAALNFDVPFEWRIRDTLETYVKPTPRASHLPVTIRFGEYNDNEDVNTVPFIAVGRAFTNQYDATEHNNQKKMVKWDNSMVMCYTQSYDGVSGRNLVVIDSSADAGDTWTTGIILNALAYGDTLYNPSVPMIADAPSAALYPNGWQVVWQEQDPATGNYQIVTRNSAGNIQTVSGATLFSGPGGDGPLPVISWAYGEYSFDTQTAGSYVTTVAWAQSDGVYYCTSADQGATWSAPVKVASIPSGATNVSISSSSVRFACVYERSDDIYYYGNHEDSPIGPVNLTGKFGYVHNAAPAVSVGWDNTHVVWEAMKTEHVTYPGSNIIHQKIAHLEFVDYSEPDLPANVSTFISRVNNKERASSSPAIAQDAGSNPEDAWFSWRGNDNSWVEFAKFRYSAEDQNNRVSKANVTSHDWAGHTAGYPALSAGSVNYGPYLVVPAYYQTALNPYILQPQPVSDYNPTYTDPEKTSYEGNKSESGGSTTTTLTVQRAMVHRSGGDEEEYGMQGVIDTGFDEYLAYKDVFYSTPFLLTCDDYVTWDVRYQRDSAYIITNDTIIIQTYLYDATTGNQIGSMGQYPLWWNTPDTSLTVGFELPAMYCPEAEVYVAIDVFEQGLQQLDRRMSVVINVETDYGDDYKRSAEQTDVAAPVTTVLSNYPNPFGSQSVSGSSSTLVQYTLAQEEQVSIVVYDMLGNKVATLVDGVRSVGSHSVAFQGDGLPSGMYFCRMRAGDKIYSSKMHLMK